MYFLAKVVNNVDILLVLHHLLMSLSKRWNVNSFNLIVSYNPISSSCFIARMRLFHENETFLWKRGFPDLVKFLIYSRFSQNILISESKFLNILLEYLNKLSLFDIEKFAFGYQNILWKSRINKKFH